MATLDYVELSSFLKLVSASSLQAYLARFDPHPPTALDMALETAERSRPDDPQAQFILSNASELRQRLMYNPSLFVAQGDQLMSAPTPQTARNAMPVSVTHVWIPPSRESRQREAWARSVMEMALVGLMVVVVAGFGLATLVGQHDATAAAPALVHPNVLHRAGPEHTGAAGSWIGHYEGNPVVIELESLNDVELDGTVTRTHAGTHRIEKVHGAIHRETGSLTLIVSETGERLGGAIRHNSIRLWDRTPDK